VPELNPSIYQNGTKIYDEASKITTDEAQKRVYQDSVMTLFIKRGQLYDDETKWIENKAYYAYGYYKDVEEMLPNVVADFERAIELNGELSLAALYPAYFDAIRRNDGYNDAYTPEQVLEKYGEIQKLLAKAEADGKDVATAKSQMENLLVAMDLIDCDFIENTMGPKLAADPTNEALADQIFNYSVQYKCYSTNAFLQALEIKHAKEPSFSTSQVIAMRYMQEDNTAGAEEMWTQALKLAENDMQKADAQMELAKIYVKQGKKSAGRAAAKEVANLDPSRTSDIYSLIGGMYMNSFNDCKGGESRAKDYSIYIAAYNAYQKAGDSSGMANARARFPSKEELFTEGLQVGSTINTGCWIGETVTLATRD
ncbi:MAG: hypothetical protein ABJJ26_11450, partial [Algoriphagus sp.]